MDANQIYCGDHFTIYTDTESLYRTPETNIMLHISYISIFKKPFSFSWKASDILFQCCLGINATGRAMKWKRGWGVYRQISPNGHKACERLCRLSRGES